MKDHFILLVCSLFFFLGIGTGLLLGRKFYSNKYLDLNKDCMSYKNAVEMLKNGYGIQQTK